MKKFWESLRKHTKNIIGLENNKLPLTKEELKLHQDARNYNICGKRFLLKLDKGKSYRKDRYHCHYTSKYLSTAHSIWNLKFNVPNEIPLVFHNDSNYDYHFIIKKLWNVFQGKIECHGENFEKLKVFFVPVKGEVIKADKDGNESFVTIS